MELGGLISTKKFYKTSQLSFLSILYGVSHLATLFVLLLSNEPEFGAGFPSSILDETRFESTTFRL